MITLMTLGTLKSLTFMTQLEIVTRSEWSFELMKQVIRFGEVTYYGPADQGIFSLNQCIRSKNVFQEG